MKYYGSHICKDCVAAADAIARANLDIKYIDITENTANLKEFLALRDSSPEFQGIREKGSIGIPCFVFDDGTISFELPGITFDTGCANCK